MRTEIRAYRLDALVPLTGVFCHAEAAGGDDVPLVWNWIAAFQAEHSSGSSRSWTIWRLSSRPDGGSGTTTGQSRSAATAPVSLGWLASDPSTHLPSSADAIMGPSSRFTPRSSVF